MIDNLKNIGGFVAGAVILLLLILLSVAVINGAVWVGENVLQWLIDTTWIVLAVNIFIILPLALFRKTGVYGGIAMYYSSLLFGLTLWFLGLLTTYFTWGFLGVFIGLALGGVGVVPVAMLAMLLDGEFFTLFVLVFLTILTFGTKFLGLFLSLRAEEKSAQKHYQVDYEQ